MRLNSPSRLTPKQFGEQDAFFRFITQINQSDFWIDVSSRPEPEPDLLCTNAENENIAFEVVRLVDPDIAEVEVCGLKARKTVFSTSDPSKEIIYRKLHKRYVTEAKHIELLVYTDGRIITPDDAILPAIRPWFDAVIDHPFHKIWFMGDQQTLCLWSSC